MEGQIVGFGAAAGEDDAVRVHAGGAGAQEVADTSAGRFEGTAGLAAGFGFAAWQDYYEAGDGLMIVTFIMAALSLAFLASALASRRKRP